MDSKSLLAAFDLWNLPNDTLTLTQWYLVYETELVCAYKMELKM